MNPRETYLIQQTLADISAGIADLEQSLRDNGFTVTGSSYLGFRYFCLDKVNINQLLSANAQTFWQNPTLPPQFTGEGTPRNGWEDSNGVKRRPPPSDKPSKTSAKAGTQGMTLLTYLKQLLFTWQHPELTGLEVVPQRWLEWLQLLIDHYARYSPTEIYAFLGRIDFTKPTFKV